MLPFLLITMLIARLKGYRPSSIFKTFTILPFLFFELLFYVMQYLAALGIQDVVRFAQPLKFCFFASLLLPIFYFKLYKHAILGSALVLTGTLLNKTAMWANNGKMPVHFTLSKLTGFANESMFDAPGSIHILMDQSTKLNILGDFIDLGYCVMSIGDIIMKAYFVIVFYQMIRIMEQRRKKIENAN